MYFCSIPSYYVEVDTQIFLWNKTSFVETCALCKLIITGTMHKLVAVVNRARLLSIICFLLIHAARKEVNKLAVWMCIRYVKIQSSSDPVEGD